MSIGRVFMLVPLLACPLHAQELRVAELGSCELDSGEVLSPCDLAYRTYGDLNADRDNAVLIPTWFGGTSNDWTQLIESGLAPMDGFHAIVVDAFGNGVSTSPTTSPTQGGSAFPAVSIGDMVSAQYRLVTEVLGLEELYAVIGVSMGGMQTFEWLVEYPDFFAKAVPIIGSPRLGAYDIARWEIELSVLELMEQCACDAAAVAYSGLRILTSQTPEYHERVTDRTTVQADLSRQAEQALASLTDGRSRNVASQLRAMIGHDISRKFDGDMVATGEAIKADLLVIVGQDDHLVTPTPALEFAKLVGAATVVLKDDCGHLSPFLSCSGGQMTQAIAEFLTRDH